MDLSATANIEDASQADYLAEIVSGVLRQKAAGLNDDAQALMRVTDSRNDIVEETQDSFDIALDNIFDALPHLLEVWPTSALEAYRLLDVARRESLALILAVTQQSGATPSPVDFRWALYSGALPNGSPLRVPPTLEECLSGWWAYH
ncbi:hypothetical protein [Halomonas aquatica]|uniref:Uncharacterized protein n=1 Tax=Halomonas aquatica TaxID=3151123 RepID=A0ABV1NL81_9GAMM